MSNWIDLDDEYPEEEGTYLCYFTDGTIETFEYVWDGIQWGRLNDLVTHWMHLPEPPEDE